MSQLSKSLEKRIQELTASIESQKTEIAAYERVLHLELSKEQSAPAETASADPEIELPVPTSKKVAETKPKAAASKVSEVAFAGNKTALVVDIVQSCGAAGASPKDVDGFFSSKNIPRSKNLIYNTLSYLVARKRLVRRDGKYFVPGVSTAPAKKTAAAPTKATASKKAAAPTKRRLSPEGLLRIKEALKKRWADKRAAEAAAARKK